MVNKVISMFFPKTCPLCEKIIYDKMYICGNCLEKLYVIKEPKCYKCGKPLNSDEKIICSDCTKTAHCFDKGIAVFEYKEQIRESLYRFKYQNQRVYSEFYAKMAIQLYESTLNEWKVDKIIPVPMYRKKKIRRGYNQAEEFADELSKYTGIPRDNKCLVRIKNTSPQKGMNSEQRRINMENAFAVSVPGIKRCRNVLLVDDIYTTGSTIDGCAKLLRAAGVQRIYFLCVAIGKDK